MAPKLAFVISSSLLSEELSVSVSPVAKNRPAITALYYVLHVEDHVSLRVTLNRATPTTHITHHTVHAQYSTRVKTGCTIFSVSYIIFCLHSINRNLLHGHSCTFSRPHVNSGVSQVACPLFFYTPLLVQ